MPHTRSAFFIATLNLQIFILQKAKATGLLVGDFGLAKIVSQTVTDISSNATPSSRGIIGTPEFMSPEQMQPEVGVDVRADIYALATIAYLMLGGKTPFAGDMMQLVMQKIMHKPAPLSTIRTDIPADVERVIMRSLEIEASERHSTAAEWIDDLEEAAADVDDSKKIRNFASRRSGACRCRGLRNDERKGSIGRSGRVVLSDVPAGQQFFVYPRLGSGMTSVSSKYVKVRMSR